MATELRVHGVNGGSAEEALDRPLLYRVAGDGDAGFFRPRADYGATTGPGVTALEAYRWGNLTSGAAARALWLLLLPFTLANVTMWLRPPASVRRRGTVQAIRAVCRVFALSMTAAFVLSFVGVALDLIGWQCAASERCTQGRSYLAPLASGLLEPTGRRLAVLALVPIAAIALLWLLARHTWQRYEGYPAAPTGDGDGLAAACFWNGGPLVGRLRAIHIATALGVVDAVLLGALVSTDRDANRRLVLGHVLAGATGVVLLAGAVLLCVPAMVDRDRPARWAEPVAVTLRVAAVVLTAATLLYALLPRPTWRTTGALPGYASTVTGLFAGQLLLLLGLSGLVLTLWRRGSLLGGLAGPILGSLAVAIEAAFSAGLSYRVADFLDRSAVPSPAEAVSAQATRLQPPASYEWSALGFVIAVVVVCLTMVALQPLRRRLRARAAAITDADFPGGRRANPARVARIDRAIAEAMGIDHIATVLGWTYLPLALVALVMTGFAVTGRGPVGLAPAGTVAARVLSFTVNLGTYLIGLFAVALLLLGVLAYRYQGVRRVVGVLWDLGTFWPRAAHPLAPPCYAERVVPELVARTTWLAGQGGVVLCGHSQGSVLAVAGVLQLPQPARAGTALLTYGSPVRRLYARLFPAYLDDETLASAGEYLTGAGGTVRWLNMWRATDPIGGPIGSPAVDVRLADPTGLDPVPGDTVAPPICGHGGYPGPSGHQDEGPFADAVRELAAALSQGPGAGLVPSARQPPPAAPVRQPPAPPV